MYKITLFGKLRDFKHQDNFCVETDKELSVKKLKNLICVYLRDQNPNNNEEIGPIWVLNILVDQIKPIDNKKPQHLFDHLYRPLAKM